MLQLKAKIIAQEKIKGRYFYLTVRAPEIARAALPGQFLQVKVADSDELLLRRPFSIHGVNGANIRILYEALGAGTRLLAQRKAGEHLDIIGPLGNGFSLRATGDGRRATILVAGGMGVAPLVFLAEKLTKLQTQVLIGARAKDQVLCEKEFKKIGCDVKISTDDGSKGFRGRVTELLKNVLLQTPNSKLPTIYACGPRPMLKEISRISQERRIPAQISLEEHMACGIGACLGCAVKTKEGYQRVCKEGPVFNAEKIVW